MKRSKRLAILGLGTVATVLIGLFFIFDMQSRREYSVLFNEMEKIRQNSLEPSEAIEWTKISYSPYLQGNGALERFGCIDIRCPVVGRSWMIPLDPNEAIAFAAMVLRNEEYAFRHKDCVLEAGPCSLSGSKNGLNLEVIVQKLGAIQPPDKDISPKTWILVRTKLTKR